MFAVGMMMCMCRMGMMCFGRELYAGTSVRL